MQRMGPQRCVISMIDDLATRLITHQAGETLLIQFVRFPWWHGFEQTARCTIVESPRNAAGCASTLGAALPKLTKCIQKMSEVRLMGSTRGYECMTDLPLRCTCGVPWLDLCHQMHRMQLRGESVETPLLANRLLAVIPP